MENTSPALEKHYSIDQVAEMWGWSGNTVRKLFRDEAGGVAVQPAVYHAAEETQCESKDP
jgi:hypothetical protein